jgi:hypothetical protein
MMQLLSVAAKPILSDQQNCGGLGFNKSVILKMNFVLTGVQSGWREIIAKKLFFSQTARATPSLPRFAGEGADAGLQSDLARRLPPPSPAKRGRVRRATS